MAAATVYRLVFRAASRLTRASPALLTLVSPTRRNSLTNVDAPYITPSREPSTTIVTKVTLEVPKR